MKIAIRMDDISPDMDWNRFLRAKGVLDEYGICPLIGVIPDNRDEKLKKFAEGSRQKAPEDFWAYIKSLENSGWIIAQHGFRHLYTENGGGLFPLNHLSEFAGVSFEDQLSKLRQGRKVMEERGLASPIFMAPAHSYDKNTLFALKQLGFSAVTDGFGARPYKWHGLNFYPISFRLEGSLKREHGVTTMVLHTNTMNEEDFRRLRRILSEGRGIDFKEYMEMEAVTRRLAGHVMEYSMAVVKRFLVKKRGRQE